MDRLDPDTPYFRAKARINRIVFPLFVGFSLICMALGLAGYIIRQMHGEQFQFNVRYGWVQTTTYVFLIATLLVLPIWFGLRIRNKKK